MTRPLPVDNAPSHQVVAAGSRLARWVRALLATGAPLPSPRRVARELARSEARFRSLIQGSSDIIAVLGPDGMVHYASPAMVRLFDHSPEGLLPRRDELTHPEDRPRLSHHWAIVLGAPGEHPPIEYRLRRRDGSWRWFETVMTNRLDDPSVGGMVVNGRDVTDRKATEAQLTRQARHAALRADVSGALAEPRHLRDVLQRSAEAIVAYLGAAHATVWLRDDDE